MHIIHVAPVHHQLHYSETVAIGVPIKTINELLQRFRYLTCTYTRVITFLFSPPPLVVLYFFDESRVFFFFTYFLIDDEYIIFLRDPSNIYIYM